MSPTKVREPKAKRDPATPEASIDDLVAALGEPAAGSEDTADGLPDLDADAPVLVSALPIDAEDDLRNLEGEASPRLMSIIESLLFASDRPLTVKQLRKLLREPTANQIRLALRQLIADTRERGVVVVQVAGGFCLRTNARNGGWVQKFLQARPVRLSRAQLETLAMVAYRQPVTRAEIEHVRGVDSGAVITGLLERDLVQIVGRKEEPGRPMVYGTTVKFLELFSLMSLDGLPDLQEFRELSDETKEGLRRRMDEDEVEALGQEVMDFAEAREAVPDVPDAEPDVAREHEHAGAEPGPDAS